MLYVKNYSFAYFFVSSMKACCVRELCDELGAIGILVLRLSSLVRCALCRTHCSVLAEDTLPITVFVCVCMRCDL
jgi:hypothetical protein